MRPTPLALEKKPLAHPRSSVEDKIEVENPSEITLNCYFNYNGLMMDAFEVLGVPAGSSRDACYRAYIDLRRKESEQAPGVVEEAWEALQTHFSKMS